MNTLAVMSSTISRPRLVDNPFGGFLVLIFFSFWTFRQLGEDFSFILFYYLAEHMSLSFKLIDDRVRLAQTVNKPSECRHSKWANCFLEIDQVANLWTEHGELYGVLTSRFWSERKREGRTWEFFGGDAFQRKKTFLRQREWQLMLSII